MPTPTRKRKHDTALKAVSLRSVFARQVDYAGTVEHEAEIRDKFLEKFAEDVTLKVEAAHFVGVSLHTVDKWIEKYPDFASAYHDLKENLTDRIEQRLALIALGLVKADKAEIVALMGYLNANRSEKYDPNRLRALAEKATQAVQVHFHFNLPAEPLQIEQPKNVTIDAEVVDADT